MAKFAVTRHSFQEKGFWSLTSVDFAPLAFSMTKPYSPPQHINSKQFVGSVSSSSNKLLEERDFGEIPEKIILYVHFARLWLLSVLILRNDSSFQAWE